MLQWNAQRGQSPCDNCFSIESHLGRQNHKAWEISERSSGCIILIADWIIMTTGYTSDHPIMIIMNWHLRTDWGTVALQFQEGLIRCSKSKDIILTAGAHIWQITYNVNSSTTHRWLIVAGDSLIRLCVSLKGNCCTVCITQETALIQISQWNNFPSQAEKEIVSLPPTAGCSATFCACMWWIG